MFLINMLQKILGLKSVNIALELQDTIGGAIQIKAIAIINVTHAVDTGVMGDMVMIAAQLPAALLDVAL